MTEKEKTLKDIIGYMESINKRIGNPIFGKLTEYDWREATGIIVSLKENFSDICDFEKISEKMFK